VVEGFVLGFGLDEEDFRFVAVKFKEVGLKLVF